MALIKKHGVILEKTENSFENAGVFNPAIIKEGNSVHMFYRAVREGNFSCIGYCKLEGPLKVVERKKEPVLFPVHSYEFQGLEDPRITKIDNLYYLSFSAYDGINVFGAYATSADLQTFTRHGIITPKFTFSEYCELIRQNIEKINKLHFSFYDLFNRYNLANLMKGDIYVWDKNIVFFPRKINGKLAFLHRLFPSIQITYFNDPSELTREFWEDYISNLQKHIVILPKYKHENSHIGAGCPPIETEDGWLLIYHSAQNTVKGIIYHVAVALLDLENPTKVIARLPYPLFSPTEPYEIEGFVNNVVFPTGTAIFDGTLYIYYGAADTCVAAASIAMNTLLEELKKHALK